MAWAPRFSGLSLHQMASGAIHASWGSPRPSAPGLSANPASPCPIAARDNQTRPPFLTHQAHAAPSLSSSLTFVHSSRSFTAQFPSLRVCCRVPGLASLPAFCNISPGRGFTTEEPIAASRFFRFWLHSLSPARRPCPCFVV